MTAERDPPSFPWPFVAALSVAQLVSWGTLFYAFALFMDPMIRDLGWSRPETTAAFSLGLLASGLGAVPVGRLIDLGHGRAVMTGGSIAAALLFAAWSRIESYPAFVLIWIGLGLTMSALLYDAGFGVLQRRLGSRSRRGIVVMTLLGGLASTVFIPLTHVLVETLGWRDALLALAACIAGFGVTIHWFVIPPQQPPRAAAHAGPAPRSNARRVLRDLAFWGFVTCVVVQGLIGAGIPVHFISLLTERGFTIEAAVAAFTVIGPAQVGARFLVGVAERGLGMRLVGVVTVAIGFAAFLLLPFVPPGSWLIVVFAVLYGASNGLMTILRAMLPPELFGPEDYGTILGMIAVPSNLTKASAPFLFGALWAWWGSYDAVLVLCIGLSVAALLAFLVTLAAHKAQKHLR
jgi:MFS family permease